MEKEEKEIILENEEREVTEPEENTGVVTLPEQVEIPFEENLPPEPLSEIGLKIEDLRLAFLKTTKKMNLINRILFGVILLLIVGSLITFTILADQFAPGPWIALGISGGLLVLVFIYTQLTKRWVGKKQDAYISAILDFYGQFLYRGNGYKGFTLNVHDRFTVDEFKESLIYRDIVNVVSRAVYHINYRDLNFKVAELMAEVQSTMKKRKRIPVFIGRYYVAPNSLEVDHPIFVYLKGSQDLVSYPSEVENLDLIETTPRYDILGNPNDKKHLSKKLLEQIRKLQIDKVLFDATFAFHAGRTYVTVNYNNDAVDFPYKDPFDETYIKHYQKDDDIIREVLALVK